jgi:hypothetical protein
LQNWTVSNNSQIVSSYMSCLAGNNSGLAVILSNMNDSSTYPRCHSTFNQAEIIQIENGIVHNISSFEEDTLHFKISVPQEFTQITIDLYDLTDESSDWYIYVGDGFIPSWQQNSGKVEDQGNNPMQIVKVNSGDKVWGATINNYGSGAMTGKLKVTFA